MLGPAHRPSVDDMTHNTPSTVVGHGPKIPVTRALGASLLLVLFSACSSTAPGGLVATGAAPVPLGTGSAPGSALASAPAATAANPGLPGPNLTLTGGSAQVAITGDASATLALTLTSGILIPGTNVILVWSGSDDESSDDGMRIQAPSRTGSYTSSATDFTAVQVSVSTAAGRVGQASVPNYLAPEADECTVTLTKVDATGVEGSLDCLGLTAGQDQAVDVSANFTATP